MIKPVKFGSLTETLKERLRELTESQIFKALSSFSQDFGEIFIVGGAVRDTLLGKGVPPDIDILHSKPRELASAIRKKMGGFYFELGKEWNIWRVITPNGETIDISSPVPNIEENLYERDFSINAICVKLTRNTHDVVILDPTFGLNDLLSGVLRTPQEENLKNDPLRLLRFYRFKSTLGFKGDELTYTWVKTHASMISKSPPERITYELYKLLEGRFWVDNLFEVAKNLLTEIERELSSIFDFEEIPLSEHIYLTLENLDKVLGNLEVYFPEEALKENLEKFLREPLASDRKRESSLKLAALLHDWGKPYTYSLKKNNGKAQITFHGHDEVGAEKTLNLSEKLKLSRREKEFLFNVVRWHMRIGALAKTYNPTEKALYRLFRDMGSDAVATALLSLADWKATYRGAFPLELMSFHRHLIRRIAKAYFEQRETLVKPKPLLRGDELLKLTNRQPGPWIRQILEELLEMQVEGKIKTREEAARWAEKKLSDL